MLGEMEPYYLGRVRIDCIFAAYKNKTIYECII